MPGPNPPAAQLTLNELLFLNDDGHAGWFGPAAAPDGDGSIKAAYITKHGTCSYAQDLQSILTTIDNTLYEDTQGSTGFLCRALGANPIVEYVHTAAFMTEGGNGSQREWLPSIRVLT